MARGVDRIRRVAERWWTGSPLRRVRDWWVRDVDPSVAVGSVGGDEVAVTGPALVRGPDPGGAEPSTVAGALDPEPWWRLLPFTTHRIELGRGCWTTPVGVDAAADVRTSTVVEACGGTLEDRTVVDLGCLEGGFTIEFARRGARRAVGIEAREISVRRCELARDLLGLDTAEFVRGDVKAELDTHAARVGGAFDVVFAAGILYHLADPAEVLRSMRTACSHVAIVCTHVAHPDRITHDCSPEVATLSSGGHRYRGRWFGEYDPSISDAQREGLLWAAWSDQASFWPFEDDLVRMILDAGFATAEKIPLDSMTEPWQVDHTARVLYRCSV